MRMRTEKDLRALLYMHLDPHIKRHTLMLERIETGAVRLGVPDLYFTTKAKRGWMELKIIDLDRTPIVVDFRPGQYAWLTRHVVCGGCSLLMTYEPNMDILTIHEGVNICQQYEGFEHFVQSSLLHKQIEDVTAGDLFWAFTIIT
jgi:hypothetical protein